jgi:hypothetical protein
LGAGLYELRSSAVAVNSVCAERRHPSFKGSLPVSRGCLILKIPISASPAHISRDGRFRSRFQLTGGRARDCPFSLAIQYPLNLSSIPRNDPQRATIVHDTLRTLGYISSTDLQRDLLPRRHPCRVPPLCYPLCGVSAAIPPQSCKSGFSHTANDGRCPAIARTGAALINAASDYASQISEGVGIKM